MAMLIFLKVNPTEAPREIAPKLQTKQTLGSLNQNKMPTYRIPHQEVFTAFGSY